MINIQKSKAILLNALKYFAWGEALVLIGLGVVAWLSYFLGLQADELYRLERKPIVELAEVTNIKSSQEAAETLKEIVAKTEEINWERTTGNYKPENLEEKLNKTTILIGALEESELPYYSFYQDVEELLDYFGGRVAGSNPKYEAFFASIASLLLLAGGAVLFVGSAIESSIKDFKEDNKNTITE